MIHYLLDLIIENLNFFKHSNILIFYSIYIDLI